MMLFWRVWYSGRVMRWVYLALPLLAAVAVFVAVVQPGAPRARITPPVPPISVPVPVTAAARPQDVPPVPPRLVTPYLVMRADVHAGSETCLSGPSRLDLAVTGTGRVERFTDVDGRRDPLAVFDAGRGAGWLLLRYPVTLGLGEHAPAELQIGVGVASSYGAWPFLVEVAPPVADPGRYTVAMTSIDSKVPYAVFIRYVDRANENVPPRAPLERRMWDEKLLWQVLDDLAACGVLSTPPAG